MSSAVNQRRFQRKAAAKQLLSPLIKLSVRRLLAFYAVTQPARPQPGRQQGQHGEQRALPLPAKRQHPDQQPGYDAGNAAPQQIAVAAEHFRRQQQPAKAEPENMRVGENQRDHDFSGRQPLL